MLSPPLERLPSSSAAVWKGGYVLSPSAPSTTASGSDTSSLHSPSSTASSADLLDAMAYHTRQIRSNSDLEKSFSAHEHPPPYPAGPSRSGSRATKQLSWDLSSNYDWRHDSSAWRPRSARSRARRRRSPLFTFGLVVGVLLTLGIGYTTIVLYYPAPVLVEVEVIETEWIPARVGTDRWNTASTPFTHPRVRPLPLPKFIGDADRLRNVLPVQDDYTHVLVPISPLTPSTPLLAPIERLPHSMMIEYYTQGTVTPREEASAPVPEGLDIVYLWVNGSSNYFQDAHKQKLDEESIRVRGRARHWRDNGELRGAMRSGVKALGDSLRKLHVVTGNYDFDHAQYRHLLPFQEDVTPGLDVLGWKMGQIPEWLDWSVVSGGKGKMTMHFHDELFRLPQDNGVLDPRVAQLTTSEVDWRRLAMPSFNSFEIESRIGWMQGLSDNFVLSNDDMFMLVPLGAADFHHPLLGPIFRFDANARLLVPPVLAPNLKSDGGEWGGLKHASSLMSKRFPHKSRMYMHHLPKSLTKSLVQEASVMFAQELTTAATRSFRESKRGTADVEISWLVSHLGVERWREALLWVWAVGKLGGSTGEWGENAREELRQVLNVTRGEEDVGIATIVKPVRSTLDDIADISFSAQWQPHTSTFYRFSSMDGHLPTGMLQDNTTCSVTFDTCFPPNFFADSKPYSAADMFTKIAFDAPECGDCLIDALITASGPRGLSAFLPSPDAVYHPAARDPQLWDREEPMLPLVSSWKDADFSIKNIVRAGQDRWDGVPLREDGGVRMLDWSVKLLSRYAYVQGDTPMEFAQIHNNRQLSTALRRIDWVKAMAMACINDDQPDNANGQAVRQTLEKWMTTRWGDVDAEWERKDEFEDDEEEEPRALVAEAAVVTF